MAGRFERFDARPGGSYRLVLTYSDASAAPGKATADAIVATWIGPKPAMGDAFKNAVLGKVAP